MIAKKTSYAYMIQDEVEKQLKEKMTEIHISISDFIKDYTIKMDTMAIERKEEISKLRKRIDELEEKLKNITLI